jgi:hypothetical protein
MLGLGASIVKLLAPAMPSNLAIEIAWNYHEETKHSYTSVRTNFHLAAYAGAPDSPLRRRNPVLLAACER